LIFFLSSAKAASAADVLRWLKPAAIQRQFIGNSTAIQRQFIGNSSVYQSAVERRFQAAQIANQNRQSRGRFIVRPDQIWRAIYHKNYYIFKLSGSPCEKTESPTHQNRLFKNSFP
jgi:hypothetical protein